MVFGERLRQLREGKYSQEELADILNVNNNTISKWENGIQEPHSKRVSELARVLGTTPAYLLGDTDNPDANAPEPKIPKEGKSGSNALIWERNGERLELPNTPETRTLFERLVMASMGNQQVVTA